MKNKKLWRGLTATLSSVLAVVTAASSCAFTYSDLVNDFLVLNTTEVVTPNNSNEDTTYFKSEFGEMNETNQKKLVEATKRQNISEIEEGAVLLRNENGALPLKENERRVSFFGQASVNPVYRCSSAGNYPKEGNMSTLQSSFEAKNFAINPVLQAAYENSGVKRSASFGNMDIGEAPASIYTAEVRESWNNDYNDVAFIFISRESGEGADFEMTDSEGISQLALHQNERDMISTVTSSGKFKKIVVLLNSPVAMEVGWLEEYGVDACLWIGTPGQWGFDGVVNILTGEVNPSGRLVDTYAKNSLSAPACVNSGTQTPQFANADEILKNITYKQFTADYATVMVEGIYVGYKYYETRYEDCILNRGGASSAAGSSFGTAWNYSNEVSYTFGYGLSYTSFEQELLSVEDTGDKITVTVKVENVGDVSGKDVVEVYVQTPYGEYEKANLIEKSAIQIVGFNKTDILAPGESQTLTVEVDPYLLASYDSYNTKGYILSEGDYYLALGRDAHDALNNVLEEKGATGLVDGNGNETFGDTQKVYKWKGEFDSDKYSVSSETGKEITNIFDDCDLNLTAPGSVTYLSRNDWVNTYPVTQTKVTASEEMIKQLVGNTYEKPSLSPTARDITQGDTSEFIPLIEMKGLSYDDAKWEKYLDQMTIDEMATSLVDVYGNVAIDSVVKNASKTGDGIDSIGGQLPYGDKPYCCVYASKTVLACTWNTSLMQRRGELMGEEGLYRGLVCIYTIGGNLHRTPFNGRNFEYISEDGNYGYMAAAVEVKGMMSKGVSPAIKHLAFNDQESYRRGVATFFNEQGGRETSLRVFEGAIRIGKTSSLMQSYNRIGCTWSSAHYGLCTELVRGEWGFEGFMITDAASVIDYEGRFEASLTAGTDAYCLDSKKLSGKTIADAIKTNDDGTLLLALRNAVKNYHYVFVNSCAINGTSADTQIISITPWWKPALIVIVSVLGVATLGSAIIFVFAAVKNSNKEEDENE